jgi:hypothetical protein
MEKKTRFAFFIMAIFTSMMLTVSCGRNKEGAITKEHNVPDSALTDSIRQSGDYQFQEDQVPQGLPDQLDSMPDSTDQKRH